MELFVWNKHYIYSNHRWAHDVSRTGRRTADDMERYAAETDHQAENIHRVQLVSVHDHRQKQHAEFLQTYAQDIV